MKSGRSGVIEGVKFALNRFKKYIASPVPAHQVITAMNTTIVYRLKLHTRAIIASIRGSLP